MTMRGDAQITQRARVHQQRTSSGVSNAVPSR
jgi:hypothetical protein